MQTKNINIEQAPLNNIPQKLALTTPLQPTKNALAALERNAPPLPPRTAIIFTPLPDPPPQRIAIVAATEQVTTTVEVEGYGPYKPVPPPKPLPQQQQQSNNSNTSQQQQQPGCFTPPPYRMPPYPLYSEPSIPGTTAGMEQQLAGQTTPQGLHTHSSKFPIEREVILSSGDKNSKIPILNEYKKRSKVAIAPDVPPKTMAAWTQGQQPITSDIQNHSGLHIQTSQLNSPQNSDHNAMLYRNAYHNPHDYIYNGQNSNASTGAVPRTTQQWQEYSNKTPTNRQYQDEISNGLNTQSVSVTIEQPTKDNSKDSQKNSKTMTKTYHTLKDMISSRFKSGKDNLDGEKVEELGLNNVAEELRKSVRSVDRLNDELDDRNMKKTAGEQGIYGKPRTEQQQRSEAVLALQQAQQQQYNQHVIQQQMLHNQQLQQQQQQQQALQQQYQLKNQQYSQLVQSRSQEVLTPRSHQSTVVNQEAVYYHGAAYSATPQRASTNRYGMQQTSDQTYVMMHHPQFGEVKVSTRDVINERCVDGRTIEPRSPQQLERDNIRRKSFEARRAASQPQLAFDEDNKTPRSEQNKLLQQTTPIRRGSHGNLIESCKSRIINNESEKDSDDGGFISRQTTKLDHSKSSDNLHQTDSTATLTTGNAQEQQDQQENNQKQQQSENIYNKEDSKVIESLTGSPRKRLEGEIGKIEGVYNVGQRIRALNGENLEIGDKRGSHRKPNGSGASSDYDKTGGQSSNADSGRGSAAYSSGRRVGNDTSTESSDTHQLPSNNYRESVLPSGHDNEWVDIVENELRHILEPKLHELSLQGNNVGVANSTVSESISSMTPPLPPLSPGEGSSPNVTPRNSTRYKHSSLPYGSKPEYGMDSYNKPMKGTVGPGIGSTRWHGGSSQKHRSNKKLDHSSILKGKQIFGLDTTDITSTTTRSLDLESMLDGQSDSDGDMSTTDARAIRKQLEGLESMYSEVLKLLGVKKHSGRYQPSDPRFSKRRYGSMSSLPSSSVSSRPIRDKRRAHDDRKKVKDIRGINKRFQRLESHVVTLARSVAHLSSEMRTQHLMIQEMENIRGEISALRTQTNMLNVRSQSTSRVPSGSKDLPSLANPTRVKKLTKFFGDEPPLLRLFLKKLGYEKYANVFENERVGMVELPYLSEERLQKMGVPLGPRLRIMQEAQISVCKDNTLCIV